jgi:hypothetical protein
MNECNNFLNFLEMENIIEKPIVTIEDDKFILHNYINQVGHKLVVNKNEAMLLYIELHKFIMGKTPDYSLAKNHICFEESSQYDNIF